MIKSDVVVDLPKPPHKIYFAPGPKGTTYVQIDSKSFIQDAQSSMPARVSIGKLCVDDKTKLHPNKRYYELFEPSHTPQVQADPASVLEHAETASVLEQAAPPSLLEQADPASLPEMRLLS